MYKIIIYNVCLHVCVSIFTNSNHFELRNLSITQHATAICFLQEPHINLMRPKAVLDMQRYLLNTHNITRQSI